jgi:hypothetical protein
MQNYITRLTSQQYPPSPSQMEARYLYHPDGVDNLSKISCLIQELQFDH